MQKSGNFGEKSQALIFSQEDTPDQQNGPIR